MAKGGSKYMKIKINTDTGEIVKINDEHGNNATEVSAQEAAQVKNDPNTKNIATIFHTHSSPGCVYIISGGWAYKICW